MRSSYLALALVSAALTGCGVSTTTSNLALPGASFSGTVHGGQQPVVGARVYLLAASTSGNGAASTSLLSSGTSGTDSVGAYVLTGASGNFSIGGDYTCTPGQQVYLLARGGDPTGGSSGTINNSAIALIDALGNCPAAGTFASSYPYVTINELTTVAATYALSGYMTDATHVSSSGSAQATVGIANAFLTAANLVSPVSGAVYTTTPVGGGTLPASEINTLADILGSCVNTNSSSSSSCTQLMNAALSGGSTGTTPTDTATAMVNVAHHPGTSTTSLFALVPGTGAPFQPTLASQPNDFSVGIIWPINSKQVAFDAAGNLWTLKSGLLEYSNSGALLSPAAGFSGGGVTANTGQPYVLAIDPQNNVWLTTFQNSGVNNYLSKFSNSGTPLSSSAGITGAGLSSPVTLAIDGAGSVFAGNTNSSISKFTNAGAAVSGSPFVNGQPFSLNLAVDNAGNLWSSSAQYGSSSVTTSLIQLSNAGTILRTPVAASSSQYSNLSVDASSNVWGTINSANGQSATPQIFKLTAAGTAAPGLPVTGNTAIQNCTQTQIDGDGNLWCASDSDSIAEASSTGVSLSPDAGFVVPNAHSPLNLAIDSSGNVWTTGGYNASFATVAVELVGAAAPVVTPLSLAVQLGKLGSRP